MIIHPGFKLIKIGPVGLAHLKWSEGHDFVVPIEIATQLQEHAKQGQIELSSQIDFRLSDSLIDKIRLYRAFTPKPPLQSKLPISYQAIPSKLRSIIATFIGKQKMKQVHEWAEFPHWPLDLSTDFVEDLLLQNVVDVSKTPAPVLLTHDLDSLEGLKNVHEYFLPLEEAVGAKSVNFIVSRGWRLDHDLMKDFVARGHELGVHGYDHSGKMAFLPSQMRKERFNEIRVIKDQYTMKGYRSPSLWRTQELLEDVSADFVYDSSIPTSGGLFPAPNNGCASARPFRIGKLFEIPLSMPRDGSMIFLGMKPYQILDLWIECAERIAQSRGTIVLLTHGEARFSGSKAMRQVYKDFLTYIHQSSNFAWSTTENILGQYSLL